VVTLLLNESLQLVIRLGWHQAAHLVLVVVKYLHFLRVYLFQRVFPLAFDFRSIPSRGRVCSSLLRCGLRWPRSRALKVVFMNSADAALLARRVHMQIDKAFSCHGGLRSYILVGLYLI